MSTNQTQITRISTGGPDADAKRDANETAIVAVFPHAEKIRMGMDAENFITAKIWLPEKLTESQIPQKIGDLKLRRETEESGKSVLKYEEPEN